MSTQEHCGNKDYSKFDEMSTEVLSEILRQDSQLPDGEESDIDAIMYITEVVASREIETIKANVSDVNTAWKTFNEKYRPYADDGKSLFEDDEDTDIPSNNEPIPFTSTKSPAIRKGRGLLRVASVAAIIIALAFAGTVTSYALGYDLWGAVAQWSKETFEFVSQESSSPLGALPQHGSESFSDLQSALNEHGINQKVVPSYLPDGYTQSEFYVEDSDSSTLFISAFMNGDSTIIIQIRQNRTQSATQYHKDYDDPEIYTVAGIEYYIMTNIDKYKVVWSTGLLENSISGLDTKDELINMIDSIYDN